MPLTYLLILELKKQDIPKHVNILFLWVLLLFTSCNSIDKESTLDNNPLSLVEPDTIQSEDVIVDSVFYDTGVALLYRKTRGMYGDNSWASSISLTIRTASGEEIEKYSYIGQSYFNIVSYVDSTLRVIEIDDNKFIVFFLRNNIDGLDPDELILIQTDLTQTHSHKCLYYKDDDTLECDSIGNHYLESYARPIISSYKTKRQNYRPN
ncbi:hypothetical protein BH09BAC1_BH09BAC1_14110 [soil metagenome]